MHDEEFPYFPGRRHDFLGPMTLGEQCRRIGLTVADELVGLAPGESITITREEGLDRWEYTATIRRFDSSNEDC